MNGRAMLEKMGSLECLGGAELEGGVDHEDDLVKEKGLVGRMILKDMFTPNSEIGAKGWTEREKERAIEGDVGMILKLSWILNRT